MKRYLIIFFVFISFHTVSQPWPGYNTSKFSGIQSLSYQPDIHSVMPSDWDINVLSANLTFFNENFFGMDPLGEMESGDINGIEDVLSNRTGVVNAAIQFPAVAYRINEKSTVGFAWRFRGLLFSNISTVSLSNFLEDLNAPGGVPVSFSNISSLSQLRDTLVSVFNIEVGEMDEVTSQLPLHINLYSDFHLHNRFYIHGVFYFSIQ
jgi:hypothetical protein